MRYILFVCERRHPLSLLFLRFMPAVGCSYIWFFGSIPSYGYVTTYLPIFLSKTSYVLSGWSSHEKNCYELYCTRFFLWMRIFISLELITKSSVQFSSVAQSCPTLCDPMDCSTPGLPVYHQLPDFTQTHVHWVSDAIQLSHPLSSPSPPTFNLSQHQGLFKWVTSH